MKQNVYIGIDIGATKILAGLIRPSGRITVRKKIPTPRGVKSKEIYKHLSGLIDQVLSNGGLRSKDLKGIAIGVPGIVDRDQKKILKTPNTSLARFPLASKLQRKYRVKVFIGNDVNLGLLGEQWLGAGRRAKNLVGIFPGTGVGGAVILNGKILLGTTGAAAEIGHMTVQLDGPMCSCGNRGCLEALASRWSIERDIRQAMKSRKRTIVSKLLKRNTRVIKSRIIKEALRKRDPLVTGIMRRVSTVLGKACISMNHIFNPEVIILGGGLIEACGDFMLPIIKRTAKKDPLFKGFNTCRIVKSRLTDDAVILGAAALLKQELS